MTAAIGSLSKSKMSRVHWQLMVNHNIKQSKLEPLLTQQHLFVFLNNIFCQWLTSHSWSLERVIFYSANRVVCYSGCQTPLSCQRRQILSVFNYAAVNHLVWWESNQRIDQEHLWTCEKLWSALSDDYKSRPHPVLIGIISSKLETN